MSGSPLAEVFVAHAARRGVLGLTELARIDAALERMCAMGRAAWPRVRLDAREFVRHVAEHLPEGSNALDALLDLHVEDLFLACAAARGDRHALEALERHFLARLVVRAPGAPAADALQLVRERLLVSRDGAPPKIATYSGQGALGAWLRIVVTRATRKLHKRASQRRDAVLDEQALPRGPREDPELEIVKASARRELKQAFEDTLASLPARERTILCLYFIDGLTTDAIGTMYEVDGSTVRRWIAHSRDTILRRARELLRERLRLRPAELESLMGLAQSRLDLSLSVLLAPDRA